MRGEQAADAAAPNVALVALVALDAHQPQNVPGDIAGSSVALPETRGARARESRIRRGRSTARNLQSRILNIFRKSNAVAPAPLAREADVASPQVAASSAGE